MDLETVTADAFGRSLTGIGLNLLTRDVRGLAGFLSDVFGLTVHRLSDDFAVVRHGQLMIQLHADGTFARHPLPSLLPENPPRGGGVQLYLFGIDPDAAIARAEATGHTVLEPASDKPHGLREATILSPEGYAFSPAVPTA
ncbi:glyoxalase [Rhodobacterales bacterium HKCCSP123]|nr:glyoxalase [Rhodobacterales bacterium HKCCSP123]